jgi:FkbM family methyltransferase
MTDYSQYHEQPAILAAFEGRPPGRFIDIGAYHPECFSNTRALFQLGWSGVCIEPSPRPVLNLLAEYGDEPRITIIQAAVGLRPGIISLHITDDAVSTSSDEEYERWKGQTVFRGRLMVPAVTLEQIVLQFGGADFWSIDAEGCSADLFLRMLALGYQPHCCCVEHDGRTTELLQAATRAGYRCVLANGTNLIVSR